MRDVAVVVLLVLGVGLELVACAGVTLMRGVFDRLHYLAPSALGAMSIGAAVVVRESFSLIGIRGIMIGIFFLVTSPVLAHVTAAAAWRRESRRVQDVEVETR